MNDSWDFAFIPAKKIPNSGAKISKAKNLKFQELRKSAKKIMRKIHYLNKFSLEPMVKNEFHN